MEGKVRKLFPGANTANGSFNFFDNIIQGVIIRIFCFKGGPGVCTCWDRGLLLPLHRPRSQQVHPLRQLCPRLL